MPTTVKRKERTKRMKRKGNKDKKEVGEALERCSKEETWARTRENREQIGNKQGMVAEKKEEKIQENAVGVVAVVADVVMTHFTGRREEKRT